MFPKLKITRIYPKTDINTNKNEKPSISKMEDFVALDRGCFISKVAGYFSSFDYEEMMDSLLTIRNWNNGLDYISADFDENWQLCNMNVGIFIPSDNNYVTHSFSKKEFLELINQIKKKKVASEPHKTTSYEGLYNQLVEKYSTHKEYK